MWYQSPSPFSDHVFYSAFSDAVSTELVRITGQGFVGIGISAPVAPLQFSSIPANRKIVLTQGAGANDHQFYGLGVSTGIFRYQVAALTDDHVFYAAQNGTTSTELVRIKGNGTLQVNGNITGSGTLQITSNITAGGNITAAGNLTVNTIITEAVIAPTLSNSFTNYGGTHENAGYYKDNMGRVFLTGLVTKPTNPTGVVIFNVPLAYRPAKQLIFMVLNNGTNVGRIDVQPDGDVFVETGVIGWFSLDNISWRVN